MNYNDAVLILSWFAVIVLSVSYWFQIWKIHVHREVRDLSLLYHYMLAIGAGILTVTALIEQSFIFFIKQIGTTLPVIVIIIQIHYHKRDRWHDDHDPFCGNCKQELELEWTFCAFCGTAKDIESKGV